MKAKLLDKLIDHLDVLDAESLQGHFLTLARERRLMETIFHAVQEGIVALDGEGNITYANRASEKLMGFSFDEAGGTPIRRYLREVDWDHLLDFNEEDTSRWMVREVCTSYPEPRVLQFYVVPLSMVNRKEGGAVLIFRDITRDRRDEENMRESERLNAITLLAAGVAHEIGNPLNSLNIHLQLLSRELAALPDEQRKELRELVDVATSETRRLDQIINQFLGALRPVKMSLERQQLDLILKDTLRFMKKEIENRSVIIEVDVPSSLPPVRADRDQVRQAFFNVIKNAIQAMPGGGILKVTLSATDRAVQAAFTDTGVGIEAGDMGRIFEPYYTTKAEGSGLGMMIIHRIMRDHGGEIEVHSEPGRGTTITLIFPREDARFRLLESHTETGKPEDR